MKVKITATQTVRYSRIVDMDPDDYAEYQALCDETTSSHELDSSLSMMAEGYGITLNDPVDWDDLEDIEFTAEETP